MASPLIKLRQGIESIKSQKIELEVKMPKAQTKETHPKEAQKKETQPKEAQPKEAQPKEAQPKETQVKEAPKAKKEGAKLSKKEFFNHLDNLTVLELAEYIKEFEERYGVSAAAVAAPMVAPGAAAPQGEAKAEEEKVEFNVVLKSVGDKKINVIKTVREVTSLGLKEAKDLVDSAPKPVKEGVSKEEAEEIKEKFEAVGAVVELQ
jgi:large subunit ribosomal protein L7/L12